MASVLRNLARATLLLGVACATTSQRQEHPSLTHAASTAPASVVGPAPAPPAPAPPAPPSSTPSAAGRPLSPPQRPEESELRARLSEFYGSLGDPAKRRHAYEQLFAPRLERFIGLRNVTRERALSQTAIFFSGKNEIIYQLKGAPRVTRDGKRAHVIADVTGRFTTGVPARWPEQVPELEGQTILTQLELGIELEVAEDGAVTSYNERDARPHSRMRVIVATRGYELPFVDGCWTRPPQALASVELAVGTVLERTQESLIFVGCGPPSSVEHFRVGGRDLWVVLALYELVANPAGGSSSGGTTFLEWAD